MTKQAGRARLGSRRCHHGQCYQIRETRFTPDAGGEAGAERRRASLAALGQRIRAGERARPRSGGAARSSAFWAKDALARTLAAAEIAGLRAFAVHAKD